MVFAINMATFAHILLSLMLSYILMKFSNGKFGIRHAIIFSVNSMVGPDLFNFLPYEGIFFYIYLFLHGYGYIIVAFLIAIPWWKAAGYHMEFKEKRLDIQKRCAEDPLIMDYLSVYCLVAAGGIMHLFVDLLSHPSYVAIGDNPRVPWGVVWFGSDFFFSMEWVLGTGMFPCGNALGFSETWVFYTITGALIVLLILFGLPKNNGQSYGKFMAMMFGIYYIPLIIAYLIPDANLIALTHPEARYFGYMGEGAYYGSAFYLTGGEAELGVSVFVVLFLFVPLMFLYWSISGVPFQKPKNKENNGTAVKEE